MRKILTIAVLAGAAALASAPAAAQSTDSQSIERQQREPGTDAFYNLATGGVPPP